MKLITFLVPCHNSEKEMRRCIDSLLTVGKTAEIIIVNDGSNDKTGEIADDYVYHHPAIVRVLHQDEAGRGDCIDQGVKHARGKYFKIVDPSDRLDKKVLKAAMKKLRRLEHAGGVDLVVCNTAFEFEDKEIKDRTVSYSNVFDTGRVLHWRSTRSFLFPQLLVLQSCIFRTAVCRKTKVSLRKNDSSDLFVYGQLPRCRRIYYIPATLYHCVVKTGSKPVDPEAVTESIARQLITSQDILKMYDICEIRKKNRRLGKYMYYEAMVMMFMATVFARSFHPDEADTILDEIWDSVKKKDPSTAFRLRYLSPVTLINLPGAFGRKITSQCYQFADKVVKSH